MLLTPQLPPKTVPLALGALQVRPLVPPVQLVLPAWTRSRPLLCALLDTTPSLVLPYAHHVLQDTFVLLEVRLLRLWVLNVLRVRTALTLRPVSSRVVQLELVASLQVLEAKLKVARFVPKDSFAPKEVLVKAPRYVLVVIIALKVLESLSHVLMGTTTIFICRSLLDLVSLVLLDIPVLRVLQIHSLVLPGIIVLD